MIELEVVLEGRLTAGRGCQLVGREEEVERVFDLTMQELLRLGVVDPSVSGSTVTGEMAMSCIVEAGSWDEALKAVDSAFRSALHAAGVRTPEWRPPEASHFDYTPVSRGAKELVDAAC